MCSSFNQRAQQTAVLHQIISPRCDVTNTIKPSRCDHNDFFGLLKGHGAEETPRMCAHTETLIQKEINENRPEN